MAENIEIPCPELPKIPEIPNISLIGGAELSSFLDFSQGSPTDCKLTFNLLIQLSPLLASMACLLKVLNVIGKLKDFVTAVPDPVEIGKSAPELLKAIDKLSGCIPLPGLALLQLIIMIKGILQLIINFFSCFIKQLESIVNFQANIDLRIAEGNPVLLASLSCAKKNGETQMDNLMLSLNPVQPLLDLVDMLAGIAGQSISLPKISDISVEKDKSATITKLNDSINSLKKVIDSLPG